MALMELNYKPAARELRVFGSAMAIVLAGVGVLVWRRLHLLGVPLSAGTGHWTAGLCWAVAGTCAVMAVLTPLTLKWLYIGLCVVVFPIGMVVSWVLLAGVYYGVFTPIGLLRRWWGSDPMLRRFDPSAPTYWIARPSAGAKERYFSQW